MALILTGIIHLVIPVPRTVTHHFFWTHVKLFHVSLDTSVESYYIVAPTIILGHNHYNSIT